MNSPLKIVHVITGLQIGGAEVMLCRLLEAMDHTAFTNHVFCLGPRGPLAERLEASGATLRCLNLTGLLTLPRGWWQLARHLRQLRPDAVHTWMYHADFLGGLAAKFGGGNPPVTWALHHGKAKAGMKSSTAMIVRILARLSHWLPERIVSCSRTSAQEHASHGYQSSKYELIFNGVDGSLFKPSAEARECLRASLGIPAEAPVIGFVGRNMPVKDLPTFLETAKLLQATRPDAHFVLCGPSISAPGLPNVHLLPFRADVQRVYPAFNVLALTSLSEACPMSLIEAMACGVPCCSTDVGDAAYIIDDPRAIAPPSDAAAIAATWNYRLSHPATPESVRARVETHFSLTACVQRYQNLYRALATGSMEEHGKQTVFAT